MVIHPPLKKAFARRYQAAGKVLSTTRDWYYVWANGPFGITDGYLDSLDGLLNRAELSIETVTAVMKSLLALDACLCSVIAVVYMWRKLGQVRRLKLHCEHADVGLRSHGVIPRLGHYALFTCQLRNACQLEWSSACHVISVT